MWNPHYIFFMNVSSNLSLFKVLACRYSLYFDSVKGDRICLKWDFSRTLGLYEKCFLIFYQVVASQSFLNGSAASTSGEVSDGSFSPPPLQVRAPPSQQAPAAGPHHPEKSTEAPAPAGSKFLNERPALWHNITERLLYHEAVGSNSKAQKM